MIHILLREVMKAFVGILLKCFYFWDGPKEVALEALFWVLFYLGVIF